MELFYGAFNKTELNKIKKAINSIEVLHLDYPVSEKAINLIEKYSKSHNLQIPDAIIAATVIVNGNDLFTYNIKDFKYIKGLNLYNIVAETKK